MACVKIHIIDREERIAFTAKLLRLFVDDDMDTYDVEDVYPDIPAPQCALRVLSCLSLNGTLTKPSGQSLWRLVD